MIGPVRYSSRRKVLLVRDRDVREVLWERLTVEHGHETDTLLLDELNLCNGLARVDVAVINGHLTGYEIKSAADTLARLPAQAAVYSAVLDYVSLVVASSHFAEAIKQVPHWWGIEVADLNRAGKVELVTARVPQLNASPEPFATARLLWRHEALAELTIRGLGRGLQGKPRRHIWQALCDELSTDELRATVRRRLKSRAGWRVDV